MRLNKVFISVFVLLVIASFTFAQTTIHWAVSGKLFLANWEETYTDYVWDDINYEYEEIEVTESLGTNPMMGLTVGAKRDKIGLSLTFFTGSGWGIEESFSEEWMGTVYESSYNYEYTRTDLIFAGSYSIHPRIGLFAGYKSVSFELDLQEEYTINDTTVEEYSETIEFSGGGVGFGAAFNYPLMPKLISFANIGYFMLGGDVDSDNMTMEVGANYVLTSNMIASASYRFESYEEDVSLSGPSITFTYFK